MCILCREHRSIDLQTWQMLLYFHQFGKACQKVCSFLIPRAQNASSKDLVSLEKGLQGLSLFSPEKIRINKLIKINFTKFC